MPAIAHQNKILGNGALVDDTTTSADKTWSSSKINTELGLKANSADVPLKTQITNPNLLDNPWFTINQRGQSTYTASGYTADRWKISGGSLELNNNGATFTTNAQYVMLEQYLPSDIFEVGKEYTISYKKTDGTYYAKTFTYANSASWATIWDNSINGWYSTYRTKNGVVELVVLDSRGSSETSVSLRAIKLELGSISTLALDTAPNYATELLKCQRYYQRWSFPQYYTIGAVSASDSWIVLFVPSQKMRVLPTVVTTGTWYTVVNDTVPAYATSLGAGDSVGGYNLGGARTSTGANTSGYAYSADAGGFVLELIADL